MKKRIQRSPSVTIKTKPSLPVVSRTTIDAMFAVYTGKKWGKLLTEVRDRLLIENPHLVEFIEGQVGKFLRELHSVLFEIALGALTVLEHQARVDTTTTKTHPPLKKY
jgi:hypothetical protein